MFFRKKKRFGKIPTKDERELARKIITSKVDQLCNKYGFSYNRISIRNQTTRLGSCSTLKNLNFNWQIIKFPEDKMEYIIKHELAHLKHPNHSKRFWNEVYSMDPKYKDNHKWTKENARKYLKF